MKCPRPTCSATAQPVYVNDVCDNTLLVANEGGEVVITCDGSLLGCPQCELVWCSGCSKWYIDLTSRTTH